jgi:hypothetical protein
VLEVSTGDYGDHNGALVAAIINGKCNDWRRRQTERSSFSYLGKTMYKLYTVTVTKRLNSILDIQEMPL